MAKKTILETGISFSDKLIHAIEGLQESGNYSLNMYVDHLDKVSDILFRMGGEMEASESKNEIFEMLHENHLLRKDLEALKAF